MLRAFALLFILFSMSSAGFAQQTTSSAISEHVTLELWPHGAPGGASTTALEADITSDKDDLIAGKRVVRLANVSRPTITLFTPQTHNSGAAVVVFPGGAYKILAMDLEGTEVCDWLTSIGVSCVLLKYRVPGSGPLAKSNAALQDAQRAVGLVRAHAAEWKIDPARIGVIGFSAGGHLVAALSTHFEKRLYEAVDSADQLSCRPDFGVLIYPAYLAIAEKNFSASPEIPITSKTPPAFIVQSEDDPVYVESATVYFEQLKMAGVQAEMHIFAQGVHGYGLRKTAQPITLWPNLMETWLHTIKILPPSSSSPDQ